MQSNCAAAERNSTLSPHVATRANARRATRDARPTTSTLTRGHATDTDGAPQARSRQGLRKLAAARTVGMAGAGAAQLRERASRFGDGPRRYTLIATGRPLLGGQLACTNTTAYRHMHACHVHLGVHPAHLVAHLALNPSANPYATPHSAVVRHCRI